MRRLLPVLSVTSLVTSQVRKILRIISSKTLPNSHPGSKILDKRPSKNSPGVFKGVLWDVQGFSGLKLSFSSKTICKRLEVGPGHPMGLGEKIFLFRIEHFWPGEDSKTWETMGNNICSGPT